MGREGGRGGGREAAQERALEPVGRGAGVGGERTRGWTTAREEVGESKGSTLVGNNGSAFVSVQGSKGSTRSHAASARLAYGLLRLDAEHEGADRPVEAREALRMEPPGGVVHVRPDRDRRRVGEAEREEDEPQLGVDRRVEEVALEDVGEEHAPWDALVKDAGATGAPDRAGHDAW